MNSDFWYSQGITYFIALISILIFPFPPPIKTSLIAIIFFVLGQICLIIRDIIEEK